MPFERLFLQNKALTSRITSLEKNKHTFQVEIITLGFHAPEVVLLVSNLDFQVLYFPLVICPQALACGLHSHVVVAVFQLNRRDQKALNVSYVLLRFTFELLVC
jgi:hypothetical protein